MSDVPLSPDSTRATANGPTANGPGLNGPTLNGPTLNGPTATRAPRWVYVSGVIAAVLVLGFVILHLTGFHGGHSAGAEHAGHATGSGHAP